MREFDLNGLRLAEYQAQLFEYSTEHLECSSAVFLRRFLHSDLLKILDLNESSRLSLDVKEGIEKIEEQYGPSKYGKIKFSKESLFWMGYFYRYLSYTRNIETPILFKIFDYNKINELYYTYHTQSMEWCVESILELYNLNENVFDKNWRLKEEMKKVEYNSKIRIYNEKIPCIKKDDLYFVEYNNNMFVIAYEKINANELCIYPSSWKIENRSAIPSVIHFETSNISEYKSKYFDKMLTLSQEIIKIIVLKQVGKVSIHPNHENKQILLPENKVNGVHIVLETEMDELLKHYNDFSEVKQYTLK